jgi:hypothetical protein
VTFTTQDELNKLPKWAQRRIVSLEVGLERARDHNRRAATGETDVFLVEYPNDLGLPPGSQVRFMLNDHRWITVRHNDEGNLTVMSDRALSILPRASNHIELRG